MKIDDTYRQIVCELKEYISMNYYRDITLNELSRKYYITNGYLSKIFKSVTGTTFRRYFYTFRINQAKILLISGKFKTMHEISRKVGFNDVSYFYRVFNKIEGITPTEYKLKECIYGL
ncbi:MAG: AraC family transcriptional regulator [Clostridiales bacterium]|nr:AraC family transcriptional regulator [Clostridiales bacterium]